MVARAIGRSRPGPVLGRWIAQCALALAAQSSVPSWAAAQTRPIDWRHGWTWAEVHNIGDVKQTEVDWLQAHLSADQAGTLFSTISELSRPEAVQMLPSLAFLEGSRGGFHRALVDSLSARPPAGDAGVVRVAYLLARHRDAMLTAFRPSTYMAEFSNRSVDIPSAPPSSQSGARIAITLDFAPAESLLAIVSTRDLTYADAYRRISGPAFDALIRHHSQGFYAIPLSREELALNLVHAASDAPLDRLYRFARPGGFYHFADVRENASKYRALLDALRSHESAVTAYVAGAIAPYLPANAVVDRRLSFFFNDLADGWAASGVAALPVEYYKDDIARMLNTIVHETFHVAQASVASTVTSPARTLRTVADSALTQALNVVLQEGTANFIAPATPRTPRIADSLQRAGVALIAELVSMTDSGYSAHRAEEILNAGASNAGPFYSLGAEMARALVAAGGPAAIARSLQGDGVDYLLLYGRALPASAGGLISDALLQAVRRRLTAGTSPAEAPPPHFEDD